MSARTVIRLALVAGSAAAPLAAHAADSALDRDYLPSEIVVTGERDRYDVDDGSTGTKTPTPLIDVPQAISLITSDQLEDQNITTLNEALRYVPGVSLETGEGHRDEAFIRGQETTADFYIDGLRDDAQYYRPLYNVERIEVLKGANALIFGRGAGGGAINRVSKKAEIAAQSGAVSVSVDSFGAFALLGDVNQPLGDMSAVRLNATYEEFDNHRDVYEGRFIGFSPTVTVDLSDATRLIASYTYDDDERVTDRGIPALDGRPLEGFDKAFFGVDGVNESRAKVHIGRARIEHDFSAKLSANATVQFADYDKVYANVLPRGTDGTTVGLSGYRDTQDRQNWIAQGNLVWQVATGGIDHTILIGAESAWQDTTNTRANIQFATATGTTSRVTVPLQRELSIPATSFTPLVRDRASDLTTISFYIQDQVELTDWLELVAGVRYDDFALDSVDFGSAPPLSLSRDDNRWSPRFGVILKPNEQMSFYASYSESFLPGAGDQFLVLSNASAALKPEVFENIEAGVKWSIQPQLLFTAAIFRLDRSNSLAPDPSNSGLVIQTGATRVEGFEASLTGEVTPDLHVNLGYTYLDGEIRSASDDGAAGTRLQQLPKHQLGLWGRYDLTDRFGLGLGFLHQSKQFASFSNAVTLPSYTRVDAAAYFDVTDAVSIQLNVENLFDTDYYPSAHGDNNIQPGAPLSASLGARFEF